MMKKRNARNLMPVFFTLLILLIQTPLVLSLRADDWPTYQHDVSRSGRTQETLDATKLGESWRHTAPHPPNPAWHGPAKADTFAKLRNLRSMRNYDPVFHTVAVGDFVYFGSSVDDSVHCLNARTGKTKWIYTSSGPIRIAPTVNNRRVYFGSDDGFAYCVNAVNGGLIWKQRAAATDHGMIIHNGRMISRQPVRTGVVIVDNSAYFATSLLPWEASYLCAVDATTGKVTGKNRFVQQVNGAITFEGPMLASATRLIVPQGRVAPRLFDRATGRSLGQVKGGGGVFVLLTPENHLLHGPGNKKPQIFTSDGANRKAKIALFAGGNAIVVAKNRSYLLTDTQLAAVDRVKRQRLWTVPANHPFSLILAGDTLFAGGVDEVAAYNTKTGKRVWTSPVDGRAYGLSVANGALFVSTDTGVIHCFRAGGKPVSLPAFGSGQKQEEIPAAPLRKIQPLKNDNLIGRWVFHREALSNQSVRDQAGRLDAKLSGRATIKLAGENEAVELNGETSDILVTTDLKKAGLPKSQITAEAWVRVDTTGEWGGIVGAIQDNGDKEYGWLLGYRKNHFSFAVNSKSSAKLTYLTAKQGFSLRKWHHVVGVYDGKRMSLYVDGKVVATSQDQSGEIRYPADASYVIGAYRDDDEHYRMRGAVHEIAIYKSALTAQEVADHFKRKASQFPKPVLVKKPAVPANQILAGPLLTFTSPTTAIVRWHTKKPMPSKLALMLDENEQIVASAKVTTKHELEITGLRRNRVYHYRIEGTDGPMGLAEPYECDTFFNYSMPTVHGHADSLISKSDAIAAAQIVRETGIDRGMVLLYGADRIGLATALAKQSDLRVVMVGVGAKAVAVARKKLIAANVYGSRIEIHAVNSYSKLPFDGSFANVVIVPPRTVVTTASTQKMARPAGGIVLRLKTDFSFANRWERPALAGAGSWTHQYGAADNSAFGGETLGGASSSSQLRAHWIGRPGPRAQADREPRKPAPLAVNGRLFVQGLYRAIAVDAFNGTILWSHENRNFVRFNMPRDSGNWCADDKHVWMAVGGHAWQINAATGDLVAMHETAKSKAKQTNDQVDWNWDWGYIARAGEMLVGSRVKAGSQFVGYWGSEHWYDGKTGVSTHKIGSDRLFGRHASSGGLVWQYENGVILNSTVTIADGRIYFVETRNPQVKASTSRRVSMPQMWEDQFLVALDVKTGKMIWDRPLRITPGSVAFYMAHGSGKLVINASSGGNYHLYTFDAKTGKDDWQTKAHWFDGKSKGAAHHGVHISRPVIVKDQLYVRPWKFNLKTGKKDTLMMPHIKQGHGCGTYAATAKSLIFRSGNIAMWDQTTGKKTTWDRLRPGCWLSTIPAQGMLLSPEAGGGCSCGSWLETSIGFAPAATK